VLNDTKTKTIVIYLNEILENRANLHRIRFLLQLLSGVILTPSAEITMMTMIGENSVGNSNVVY